MIYIACPYWHEDPAIREERVKVAGLYAVHLMLEFPNTVVFSPITYGHNLALHLQTMRKHIPGFSGEITEARWLHQSLYFLAKSNAMHVLQMEGWQQSKGVEKEIEYAIQHRINIIYPRRLYDDIYFE